MVALAPGQRYNIAMRIISILAAAIVLAGCATAEQIDDAQQLVGRDPRVAYVTPKSPDDVRECIHAGIRAVSKSGHTVSTRDEGEARVVWVTALGNPVLSVQITPGSDGTRVEYRSRFKAGSGHYTNAVSACR